MVANAGAAVAKMEAKVPDPKILRRIRRENTDRSITTTNWHYYEGSATLKNFVLLTGNSNPSLCNQIARYLGIQRAPAKVCVVAWMLNAIEFYCFFFFVFFCVFVFLFRQMRKCNTSLASPFMPPPSHV